MAVSVAVPNRVQTQDQLEKLATAISIAKGIYDMHNEGTKTSDARKKQLEETALAEKALSAKTLKENTLSENELATGGFKVSDKPQEGYNKALILPIGSETPLVKYVKKPESALFMDPFGAKALGAQKDQLELDAARKKAAGQKVSPIKGFAKVGDLVIEPKDTIMLKAAQGDVNSFNNKMDGLIKRVQEASQIDLANPASNTSKKIMNDLRDIQLTYKGKSFADLGVLAGPDLMLLENIIENPGTLSNLVSGKEGVIERYRQAKDRLNQSFATKAQAYGLEPMAESEKPPSGPIVKLNGKELDPKDVAAAAAALLKKRRGK